MKFINTIKAERSIAQLLEESDVRTPTAKKAAASLKKLGPAAIPKVIEALASADKEQTTVLVETLSTQVNDKTFSHYAEGLGHGNQRCISGVAWALSSANSYDANQLLNLLGDCSVSTPAVIDILQAKKQRLNLPQLLRRVYEVEPREKAALFKIVGEIATEDAVPDLISRMSGKDLAVRVHLIHILSRFNRPDVARALENKV
jgi:serine/threonine-protein kinase